MRLSVSFLGTKALHMYIPSPRNLTQEWPASTAIVPNSILLPISRWANSIPIDP